MLAQLKIHKFDKTDKLACTPAFFPFIIPPPVFFPASSSYKTSRLPIMED